MSCFKIREIARAYDLNVAVAVKDQQILVTGDNALGLCRNSRCKYLIIVRVGGSSPFNN
jgi:hypothetical protein